MDILGDGMTAEFCPGTPATRHRYGTISHYKYYARKSRKFHAKITYQDLCEWTKPLCREVIMAFENHYNSKTGKQTKWGIMVHPDSQRTIKEIKGKGSIENCRVTLVFSAQTDMIYHSKFDYLIKSYFYFDPINSFSANKTKVVPKVREPVSTESFDNTYAHDVTGLSRETINDAFESDPDAYWNND